MDPISRPENVVVPRGLQRRIEVRRALADGSADAMRTTLRDLGEKVPANATKEQLQVALHNVARGFSAFADMAAPTTAPAARRSATTAQGGE